MQAFEWTKLIQDGVRPWGNPWGAEQFGATFFMITGFHGTHVTIGVIFLMIIAFKVRRGDLDNERPGFLTGPQGPLRDRRDPGPVLALRRSGVGVHLRVFLSLVGGAMSNDTIHEQGQQHPISIYFWIWGCCSYSARCPTWWIFWTFRACCAGL
jgi:hypothetical protein